ncbi:hypothetical protein E2C01_035756 [Portunus trituberculatus]|uniref:Uncharacterized protein n=1 Tax=Portunus trituberculatus TaxID=210409 RepID=A0A5B7F6S4_PORTR|nr:hypothetical protein [Portunus trituberculatus]
MEPYKRNPGTEHLPEGAAGNPTTSCLHIHYVLAHLLRINAPSIAPSNMRSVAKSKPLMLLLLLLLQANLPSLNHTTKNKKNVTQSVSSIRLFTLLGGRKGGRSCLDVRSGQIRCHRYSTSEGGQNGPQMQMVNSAVLGVMASGSVTLPPEAAHGYCNPITW